MYGKFSAQSRQVIPTRGLHEIGYEGQAEGLLVSLVSTVYGARGRRPVDKKTMKSLGYGDKETSKQRKRRHKRKFKEVEYCGDGVYRVVRVR